MFRGWSVRGCPRNVMSRDHGCVFCHPTATNIAGGRYDARSGEGERGRGRVHAMTVATHTSSCCIVIVSQLHTLCFSHKPHACRPRATTTYRARHGYACKCFASSHLLGFPQTSSLYPLPHPDISLLLSAPHSFLSHDPLNSFLVELWCDTSSARRTA